MIIRQRTKNKLTLVYNQDPWSGKTTVLSLFRHAFGVTVQAYKKRWHEDRFSKNGDPVILPYSLSILWEVPVND